MERPLAYWNITSSPFIFLSTLRSFIDYTEKYPTHVLDCPIAGRVLQMDPCSRIRQVELVTDSKQKKKKTKRGRKRVERKSGHVKNVSPQCGRTYEYSMVVPPHLSITSTQIYSHLAIQSFPSSLRPSPLALTSYASPAALPFSTSRFDLP